MGIYSPTRATRIKIPFWGFLFLPVSDEEPTGSERSASEVKGAQQNRDDFIAAVKATQTNGL